MKKYIILSFLILMTISTISAQNKKGGKTKKADTNDLFLGTIKKKPWNKSTQSYCARGSEYYVLSQNDDLEIVIQNNTKIDLESWVDKKVEITGKMETRSIKANPMEQRPVNPFDKDDGTFKCSVLDMKKIEQK